MKNIIYTTSIAIFFCTNLLNAQTTIDLTPLQKDELYNVVVPSLKTFLYSINCEYVAGTSIDEYIKINDNRYEVKGKVSYESDNCSTVKTEYKVTLFREGDYSQSKVCVNTPYCTWGVAYKKEWDCKGGEKSIWKKLPD